MFFVYLISYLIAMVYIMFKNLSINDYLNMIFYLFRKICWIFIYFNNLFFYVKSYLKFM